MKILIFTFLLFSAVGCLRNVSPENYSGIYTLENYRFQPGICEEINATGDIQVLMDQINRDIQEALNLLESPNHSTRARITELAGEVSVIADKISKLAKPEWTRTVMGRNMWWRFDNLDFSFTSGFKNIKVHSVYYAGKKRDDLIERFGILNEDFKASIHYNGTMSYLDYCQLEKTMIIVLEVKLRKPLGLSDTVYLKLNLKK